MGSKYTTQSVSGYNASPPPDDGSTSSNNKITWNATIKAKLADPILTLSQAVNTALLSFTDFSQTIVNSNYTTVGSDHMKSIDASGTTTVKLMDASSATVGYIVTITNVGTNTVTVSRATLTDTLNGATKDVLLSPGASAQFKSSSTSGYEVMASYNLLFDQTDPSKQVNFVSSAITTGTVRNFTFPDRSSTLATIGGDQTFTGNNTYSGTTTLSSALTYGGVTLSNSVTGTGSMVLSTSPTLVTPALGTPSAIVLTSATGLPLTTGVTGTLPIANGGTNSTATATAGGAGYGTGTAHAYTAAGTAGQVLTSAGASAPVWSGIAGGTF